MHVPAGSDLQAATALATDDLAALFSHCHEGYFVPVSVDRAALERMIRGSSLDLDASRVRFENGIPTGLAMLGRRGARGWIGGMGMIPERRGHGGGRVLMEAVLEQARALPHGHPAAAALEAAGFTVRLRQHEMTLVP